MSPSEHGPAGPQMKREGDGEEQEASRLSREALEKSRVAYREYTEAYERWQAAGSPADKRIGVDASWLKYTEAYNDYLEIYRKNVGTLGYQERPYPVQHM